MGNEEIKAKQNATNRRRSLPIKNNDQQDSKIYQKDFKTINQSLEVPRSAEPRQFQSLDFDSAAEDKKSIKSDRRRLKIDAEQDHILQNLSKKNEQLRRQLKKISDELTEQIKHKKLVPKKKGAENEDEEGEDKSQANAGLRRELQNGYKQIQMYKRTLEAYKGKSSEHESSIKIKLLENAIAQADQQINVYSKRIEGVKKIKFAQDKVIEKDISDDLKGEVGLMKKEAENIKTILKELAKRDRQRQVNYKKQQAYLFEVERKYREVRGDYFPQIKKRSQAPNPIASRVTPVSKAQATNQVSIDEYFQFQQELNALKSRHEEYHKKIDAKMLIKNKLVDQNGDLDENIRYNDKIIETLKMKLTEIKKIFRPTKKSLFGYDNYSGTELQNQYNGGVDQIEKEIQEQNYQDQFDIKHLIANIPKPARPKVVVEFQDQGKVKPVPIPREISREKGGMIISGEKAEPKKWGSSLTRTQQKGRAVKKESVFQDSSNGPPEAKPLIIGINVWVNKNNAILGLQAIYLTGQEIRYGSKSSNTMDGFLQRYDLQSPDYLKNITGAFSHEGFLQYLILYSKQGKVGTFGVKGEGQQQFNYGLSSSQRPFRIFGASFIFDSEPRINRIGLQICQQQ